MERFISREAELNIVEETLNSLQEGSSRVRTPIIEICGVGGIGKTTFLLKIQQCCQDKKLASINVDASVGIPNFYQIIMQGVKRYTTQPLPKSPRTNLAKQTEKAIKSLLACGPLVLIIDSLDTSDKEQFAGIETILQELIEDNQLFVILASKKYIPFDNIRSIARRIVPIYLKTIDRYSNEAYLDDVKPPLVPEIRDTIFEWTRGYPLATNIMTQAILEQHLDPRNKHDQKPLISTIVEQIMYRVVLARNVSDPEEYTWYQTMLSLLSVPRSVNVPIIGNLIERFAPQYTLSSKLAYMALPKRLNQATEVISWSSAKAGFSIEVPLRNIFLLKLKIEQPETFLELHTFLAQTRKQIAMETSGSDKVRNLQEYLYHSACAMEKAQLQEVFHLALQVLALEAAEYQSQFFEEISRDEEIKEVLGKQSDILLTLIQEQIEYKDWASTKETIDTLLLQQGFVDTSHFFNLSHATVDRLFFRYAQENAEKDLECQEATHSLRLRHASIIQHLQQLFNKLIASPIEGHGAYQSIQSVELIGDCLTTLSSILKYGGISTQHIGTFPVYFLETGTTFENLSLPNPLPVFAILDQRNFESTLESIRHSLVMHLKKHICLLLVFCEDGELKKMKEQIEKVLHQAYALDVVVLSPYNILEIVSAKNPERILRRLVLAQMNLALIAPYTVFGPTPIQFFFGREHELREICEHIHSRSYVMIGGRRIGKTSLVGCLHQKYLPRKGFYSIYYDCAITPNYQAFLQTPIVNWQPEPPPNAPENFQALLHSYDAATPLVLLLDEADKLVPEDRKHQWQLFKTLRALVNARRLQVILSGERLLRETLRDSTGPFYNFGSEMLIGRLDEQAVAQLVTQPMKQLEIELVEETAIVQRIWTFSSGHPNIVQRLCQRLIELLKQKDCHQVTLDDVQRVVEDPAFQRKDFLETYWEQATILERILSLLLAQTGQQVYTLRDVRQILEARLQLRDREGKKPGGIEVDSALNRLVDLRSILASTPEGYTFAVRAFPLVVQRPRVVTIDDLLEIYSEAYSRYGDLTYEEVALRDTQQ